MNKTINEMLAEIKQLERQKEIGMAQVEAYYNGIINYLQQQIQIAQQTAAEDMPEAQGGVSDAS